MLTSSTFCLPALSILSTLRNVPRLLISAVPRHVFWSHVAKKASAENGSRTVFTPLVFLCLVVGVTSQVYLLSNASIRYLLQYHPFLAEDLRISLEEAVFQQARYLITICRCCCGGCQPSLMMDSISGDRWMTLCARPASS